MKIPNSVRIGGIEYAIEYKENVRSGKQLCYGVIHYDDSTITLSTSDGAGHQQQCLTLWHEILHGILEHASHHIADEEEVVEIISKGIYQVLQDNERRFFDIADGDKVAD